MGRSLTAIGLAVACLLGALYLLGNQRDAALLRDASRAGAGGRLAEATDIAARVTRAPADGRARLVEAYALQAQGRGAAAERAFAAAARRDPNAWVVHRDFALLLARRGRTARAREEMERALQLNPRMTVPAGFRLSPPAR